MMLARHRALSGAVAAVLLAAAAPAWSQAWPAHQIRLIVPFAPGGTTDVVARAVAAKISADLKQAVVVENRPGAGGGIGAAFVAKATPDGYTLLLGSSGTLAYNPSLYPHLQYDPVRDFAPVGLLATSALILVSNPASPAKSVPELIRLAKAEPRKLTYATAGSGSATHIATEYFNSIAGIKTIHVPYKGSGPATVGVVAGETDYEFTGQTLAWPLITSGKLRAIGLASDHRNPDHPDVPTVAEAGLAGFDAADWDAIMAPTGTPAAVVQRLNVAIQAVLKDPELKATLGKQGIEVEGGTPEALETRIRTEIAKWAVVIKGAHIVLE